MAIRKIREVGDEVLEKQCKKVDKIMTMFIIKVICERGEGNEFKYNRGNFTIYREKYNFKQSDVCNGICPFMEET